MKIRDFILSLVSWFILLVTVSCSDELGGERAPISSESNLHVLVPTVLSSRGTRADDASGLPTYNATVDECQINDLTLYAFPTGNEGGKLLVETLPAPLATMMVEQHVANYQLNIEPGTYHIYVVANMNQVLSGKTIKTENDLKKIVLDYRPTSKTGMPVCTNIPMIYEPKDAAGNLAETVIKAAGDKYTEVAANLKFTCVKVKLNLIFDSSIAEFGGKTFSINSISADKLSPFTHLYWGGKFEAPTWTNNEEKEEYKTGIQKTLYDSQTSETLVYYNDWSDNRSASATNNNDDIKGTGTAKDAPDNAAGKWLFQQTYYLPERYISSESDRSYLTIKGNVGGSVDNNYRINLGHKKDETSTVPVFPRGTFYEITGAIKTLGNMELDCKVSVKPWEMETISADFNHTTLWVSKTKASVTSTTADSIDYESNVMLTEADFGCDEKVTTSSGEKEIVLTKLDAVKHRITFNINKDIQFSDYKGNYKGTAKVWIKAGNIKKYLDVTYDASPYFEVNPQEVTIYWGSDNSTKLVQFKTNLGGLAFTGNTSSTVGNSTIQASCDNPDTPEGTFKIVATTDPVTTTVHYLTVQPKKPADGINFVTKIKVTVKPAVGNYRINFRAINDRTHYSGGNTTDNYEGTPDEKKEETFNGEKGNTNWADGWYEYSWCNNNKIYTPQPDNHYTYVYTQIGETTGNEVNSPVWKFTGKWPGDKMVEDKTNVGWYYKDFPKEAKPLSTENVNSNEEKERTIKPGETLVMFSNNSYTDKGYSLHRCPHHLEPGIPLFDYEDKEGWIVYDPTSDPTWHIYDNMPTIENIKFTIYTQFQTYGWFKDYGIAQFKNNSTEREQFTIFDKNNKSWICTDLKNGWYETVITLKAVKGDHEKDIRIMKDNQISDDNSILLFNGNSYEKYNDTGYYDGSWHAGKPSGVK